MKTPILCASIATALLFAIQPTHAGTFSVSGWTGDGDSGIPAPNYTAVVDFAGNGTRVINGLTFTDTGTLSSSYQLVGAPDVFTGFANALSGAGSNGVATDFRFSGSTNGNASVTLGNLIPGQNYVTTWYNAGFGPAGGRFVNITPGDTGVPFLFDENQSGNGNGNLLTYSFTAVKSLITFSFDAVANGDSFHHYALTNAGPTGAAPLTTVNPIYSAVSGSAPFSPFSPLNSDLLQTSLLGAPITVGNFTQEGAGGASILNNGAFSISGGVNPQLATGENNASVTYNLNLSGAPLGYDISQIIGYGGWNDAGRDRQLYNVMYSIVGDSGFALLGTANGDNGANPNQPSAIQALFNTTLTGVDAIRFDFLSGQENGYAGYGEFDVVGAPTVVPEPGAASLLGLSLAALAARRRNRG